MICHLRIILFMHFNGISHIYLFPFITLPNSSTSASLQHTVVVEHGSPLSLNRSSMRRLLLLSATTRWSRLAHLARLEHLVTEKQVRRNTRRARNAVPQYSETVVDTLLYGIHGLAECEIQTCNVAVCVFVLEGGDYCKVSILAM